MGKRDDAMDPAGPASHRVIPMGMLFLLIALALISCRGGRSELPPIHLNPNMMNQARFNPQTLSRTPPDGVVAFGRDARADGVGRADLLKEGPAQTGRDASGKWVARIPAAVTGDFIDRGRERFDIHCAVCHGETGSGKTVLTEKGLPPPTALINARVVAMADGEIFGIITAGARNMAGLGKRIPAEDRWAIVAYVRALQAARRGVPADLSDSQRGALP